MPVYWLTDDLVFPPPEEASEEGVVAIGGDLRPERLVLAYAQGIFPWPHDGLPLLWFSPDPRFVIDIAQVHIPRSLRKRARQCPFTITSDTAFEQVIDGCASVPRPGQPGTWIDPGMRAGYVALHARGLAHSVEAWEGETLVGGLYGVSLGRMFCGESMFARRDDASKLCTLSLLGNLRARGFAFVDCQVYTDHLARFGAQEWSRQRFLHALRAAVSEAGPRGPWHFDLEPAACLALLQPAAGDGG